MKPGHFSGCPTTEVQIEVLIVMFGPFDGGRMGRRRKLVLIVVCRRSHIGCQNDWTVCFLRIERITNALQSPSVARRKSAVCDMAKAA